MTQNSEFNRKILSLDQRRAGNDLAFAMGKFGMPWVLEVCAEVFDEIAAQNDVTELETGEACTKALMLRALQVMFTEKENVNK